MRLRCPLHILSVRRRSARPRSAPLGSARPGRTDMATRSSGGARRAAPLPRRLFPLLLLLAAAPGPASTAARSALLLRAPPPAPRSEPPRSRRAATRPPEPIQVYGQVRAPHPPAPQSARCIPRGRRARRAAALGSGPPATSGLAGNRPGTDREPAVPQRDELQPPGRAGMGLHARKITSTAALGSSGFCVGTVGAGLQPWLRRTARLLPVTSNRRMLVCEVLLNSHLSSCLSQSHLTLGTLLDLWLIRAGFIPPKKPSSGGCSVAKGTQAAVSPLLGHWVGK